MIAELIAVGTELLLGSIANTDAQMISQRLSAMGITVLHHTVVGDNPQRLAQAMETARDRADIQDLKRTTMGREELLVRLRLIEREAGRGWP